MPKHLKRPLCNSFGIPVYAEDHALLLKVNLIGDQHRSDVGTLSNNSSIEAVCREIRLGVARGRRDEQARARQPTHWPVSGNPAREIPFGEGIPIQEDALSP